MGETGGQHVRALWLKRCIPENSESADVDKWLEASASILKGKACAWATAGVQEELNTADLMLKSIKQGTPMLPGVQVKPWVAQVAQNLMKENKKVVHKGVAALDYLLNKFKENPPTSLCELRLLNIWRHTLKESDVELVIQWRDGISKKEPPTKGKKAPETKKAKTKKQIRNDEDLDAAAMAFLSMPAKP
eukprot:1025056-Amphidinium_carterae.1